MGHTLPSATQVILNEFSGLRPLYGALRRSDQLILDSFFESILRHRSAIHETIQNAHLLPLEIMPYIVLLEDRKRNSRIHIELFSQIEALDKRLTLFLPPEEPGDGGF